VLALFREHRPDITIMDLRLPGMSGFDAIRAIRADDPSARLWCFRTTTAAKMSTAHLRPEYVPT
jgi:CheY-like chemotaxis protein